MALEFRANNAPIIPIITGPTGVGKTNLSLDLAELLSGEIVSADSRQIYRGMNIGTAKPTAEETRGIPHHLIDVLNIDQHVSAGLFLDLAEQAFSDIISRGKTPIVVGGSTLYISALTHGLSNVPSIPDSYRKALEKRAASEGIDVLFEELSTADPVSAATMDQTKSQRIIRALEVLEATGNTLSSYHASPLQLKQRFAIFVLNRPRDVLYDRINRRVDAMMENGLVAEVELLRDNGNHDHFYPLRSPGYSEVAQYLKKEIDRDEMVRLIKRNTRRYAKRQLTWFRRYGEEYWVDANDTGANDITSSLGKHVFHLDGSSAK